MRADIESATALGQNKADSFVIPRRPTLLSVKLQTNRCVSTTRPRFRAHCFRSPTNTANNTKGFFSRAARDKKAFELYYPARVDCQ